MTTKNNIQANQSRWLIAIGTVIVMTGLGTIYTWSLFNQPLTEQYGWKVGSVATTFSILSFALSFATLFASKIQEKFGIRRLLIFSGIGMGIGLIVSSFATELWILYIFAGVVTGGANGIAYIATLSNAIQWFPEKKGFISGITIGSYGLSSVLFKYVFSSFITNIGVSQTFLYWGIICLVMIIGGSLMVRQAELSTKDDTEKVGTEEHNFTPKEMLHTKESYLLFFILFTSCMSGLYLIGSVANVGVRLANLNTATAANAVVLVAIFNTLGRLVLGTLSDHFKRLKIVSLSILVMGIAAIILSHVQLHTILFFVCAASVGFCFGGNITIFPAIVSEFFGLKNQSINYGIIYQGFGLGGLSASFISILFGGFIPTFNFIAILCIISSVIALVLQKPQIHYNPLFRKKQLQ